MLFSFESIPSNYLYKCVNYVLIMNTLQNNSFQLLTGDILRIFVFFKYETVDLDESNSVHVFVD